MKSTWTPTTKVVVVSVFIILLGIFIYAVRPLISPIIVAALIAYTLHPLVDRLENHPRISPNGAVLLVYFPFLIIIFAAPGTLVPLLVRQIRTLTDEIILVFNTIEKWLSEPVVFLGQTISQEQLAAFLSSATESFTPAADDAIQVLEATSASLLWLVVILVTTYYLLADWDGLRRWFINIFPTSEQVDLVHLLHEIDVTWRAYLRGTLMLMFIMGIFFIIVGLAIGLPGAVALGLLTGLLSMIPELGPTIAGILASLVAFLEGSSYLPLSNFWFAILVAGIYIVVMQVKSLWLRPIVMGRFMHMNTGLVFVAIIGSALIFGILAALIVLPVVASLGQIGHYLRCKLLDVEPYP
jgi:predicted PurR-regulated permease PerM